MYFANLLKSRDSRSFIGLNLSNDLYFEEYNEVDPGGPGTDGEAICIGFDNTGNEPQYAWEDRNNLVWVRELKPNRPITSGKMIPRRHFVTSNVRPITVQQFKEMYSYSVGTDPAGGSERQATKLIAELMKEFGIRGVLWERTSIIAVLKEQNAEHGTDYPVEFHPEIIDAVKASEEWRKLPIYSDASEIGMYMDGSIVKIAEAVMEQMFELGEYKVTLESFTNDQLFQFSHNEKLSDREIGLLIYASPIRVRALRAFLKEIVMEDQP